MKKILFVAALFHISGSLNATGAIFGDGEFWLNMCKGKHSLYTSGESIKSCQRFLVGFQLGAVMQSQEAGIKATLCGKQNFENIQNEFIKFIEANPKLKKEDILKVLVVFTKSENNCGL